MCQVCTQPLGWKAVDVPAHPLRDGTWVEIQLEVRLNQTGEIRTTVEQVILNNGDPHPNPFHWEEGNNSCDCNREAYFYRAQNLEEPDDTACTEGRYSVRLTNPVDGKVFYNDF